MRSKLIIIIAALALAAACIIRRRKRDDVPAVIRLPDGTRIQKATAREAEVWMQKHKEWYPNE